MVRASSPPEATRARAWTGSPTLAPSASSTGSPGAVRERHGPRGAPRAGPAPRAALRPAPRTPPPPWPGRRAQPLRPRPARPAPRPARRPGAPRGPRRPRGRPGGGRPPRRTTRRRGGLRRTCAATPANRRRRSCTSARRSGSSSKVSTSSRRVRARSESSTTTVARRSAVAFEQLVPVQRAGRFAQQVERATLSRGRVDPLGGERRGVPERAGVREALLLQAQRRLLVGIVQMGGGDLVDLVAQHVGLAGPLLLVPSQLRQRGVDGAPPAAQVLHPPEVGAGESIEDTPLGSGGGERLVLVLAVQLDELGHRLGQHPERGHAPVQPGFGAPRRGHGTGDDHLALGCRPRRLGRPRPSPSRSAPRPAPRPRRSGPCPHWPDHPAPAGAPRRRASCRPRSRR